MWFDSRLSAPRPPGCGYVLRAGLGVMVLGWIGSTILPPLAPFIYLGLIVYFYLGYAGAMVRYRAAYAEWEKRQRQQQGQQYSQFDAAQAAQEWFRQYAEAQARAGGSREGGQSYQRQYEYQPRQPQRSARKDPYQVLGVQPGASQADIRSAYLRMAKEFHPDRVAGQGETAVKQAEEKMKDINEAYSQLRN